MLLHSLLVVTLLGEAVAVVDQTLSPGADGRVVVEAVVDRIRSKCIFGEDRLFLRRLAYVETSDGEDPKTYRAGYHGGIWQIDEDRFDDIPTCLDSRVRELCNLIDSSFNINWSTVTWADLRKPLYSGLAAALFIQSRPSSSRDSLASQATFWTTYMRTGGQTSYFITQAPNLPGRDCKTELDLAFIIDGSGSVNFYDFQHMLRFIQSVVGNLSVNENEVQIAAQEYSTVIGTTITFSSFTNKPNLIRSIGNIKKGNMGTNTQLAIKNTTDYLFSPSTGARSNAKRVAILLTDGASNDRTATIKAAADAKAKGITLFTVGVGNVNQQEIEAVATAPNCTHVFILSNFREIDALLYQLKDSSCSAATAIPPTGANITITKTIPLNETVTETFVANPPASSEGTGSSGGGDRRNSTAGSGSGTTTDEDGDHETVVKSEVHCGSLQIYASYDTPRPGPAFYDINDQATDNSPSIIYLNETLQGRPLYMTVIGSRLPLSAVGVTTCLNSSYTVAVTKVPKKASVVCRVGQTERTCTEEDFRSSQYSDLLCDDSWSNIINPCTPGTVEIQEHPSDPSKFIRCDFTGKMYITQCPNNDMFNPHTASCSHQALGSNNGVPLPSDLPNPCTAVNMAVGKFHFSYTRDKSKFILCDVWANAWVMPCPEGLEWNDSHSTCTPVANKCKGGKHGTTFAHSQPNKYITCVHGQAVVHTCPLGLVFNTQAKVCAWSSRG